MTKDAAVARGSCFVFIRSTTGIGFDSSTSGGSFTGKNTSRRLVHKEASVPSSCSIIAPSLSEDSTPACNTGPGFTRSSLGTISNSDKSVCLSGSVRPWPLCPSSRISRALQLLKHLPVFRRSVSCCARFWPHKTFYKRIARGTSLLSLTQVTPRKSRLLHRLKRQIGKPIAPTPAEVRLPGRFPVIRPEFGASLARRPRHPGEARPCGFRCPPHPDTIEVWLGFSAV